MNLPGKKVGGSVRLRGNGRGQKANGGRKRVLIVDDNQRFRQEMASLLAKERDIEVVGMARDGLEAVEMAARLKPDIVLMDQQMPGLTGIEATVRIRENRLPAQIFFVAGDPAFRTYAMRAGADEYFLKGTQVNELLQTIRAAAGETAPGKVRPAAQPTVERGVKLGQWGVMIVASLLLLALVAGLWKVPSAVLPALGLMLGGLFFLYALKYYAAVGLILFASAGNGNGNGNGRNGNGKGRNGHRNGNGRGLANGNGHRNGRGLNGHTNGNGLKPVLARRPFVSIHLPMYNEKDVVDRLLAACTSLDYTDYEVIVADDSTDETTEILRQRWGSHPRVKISHRGTRRGFKGGALQEALKQTDSRAEYIVVFDADFIPPPGILDQFLAYFYGTNGHNGGEGANGHGGGNGDGEAVLLDERVAVVQGYQWHVLNASENWITRAIRSEYSGSYVVERGTQELVGALKMVSGSVFMIRADVLRKLGWRTSITEDWELTLRLYLEGFKVLYTPFVQAPAECVSGLRQLIRQRMRWAEGHTYNVKRYFWRVMSSQQLTGREKLEFLYYVPYYLQAAFFMVGTTAWLLSELVFRQHLPFWSDILGWSLVFTNVFSLGLMNLSGLFLERGVRRGWLGLLSFLLLTYLLVPYQAYASLKGLLEPHEGGWDRTQKTGVITEVIERLGHVRRLSPLKPKSKRRSIDLGKRLGLPAASITRHFPQPLRQFLGRTGPGFRFASILATGLLLLGILAHQVGIVGAAPDVFYLHDSSTSGITPAGRTMNISQGVGAATMTFDSVDDEAYWYTDLTYPTGSGDASIAGGDYTLNMYFSQLPQVPSDWYNASWLYRKAITVYDHAVAAGGVSNFPVLVNLGSDAGLAANAQDDGDDILFTSSDGTSQLSHEIETFDGGSGALVAWVNVPNLSSSADTVFYMYYGNPSAPNQEDLAGVWSTSYLGVWHLAESGDGSAGEYQDSSQYLNHGQGGQGDPRYVPAQVSGQIGNGQDFNIIYGVGDASVGLGSNIVTFGGGASVPLDIAAGDYLTIDPGGANEEDFVIASRDSATQVTVTTNATIAHSAEAYVLFTRDTRHDLIDVGNADILDVAGDEITLEAWVQHNVTMPPGHQVYGILNHKGWNNGYSLWMQSDEYQCPSGPLCVTFNLPGATHSLTTATTLTAGTWHHVVATYNGTSMVVFIDGVQDVNTLSKTGDITAPSPPEDDVWIGHGDQPTDVAWSGEWEGQLDEVRISNVARTTGWIQTEYANQSSPGTFYGLGGEEILPRVQITVSVYHTNADGLSPTEIVTSATTTIDPSTPNPYALSIGAGSAQTYTAAEPQRLRALITVTSVSGGGSFTLAYDSGTNPSSLDTPVLTVPEWNLVFLAFIPLVPMLTSLIWRRRRLAARLALVLVSVLVPLGILAQQVGIVGAAPDVFYLHDASTSGITPAGRTMNISQGVGAATMTFDSVDDDAYWYTDLTYPTGSDPATIAGGNYTLNMYFSQLPQAPSDWYNPSWLYRKPITIDGDMVASGGLSYFPVLINLTSDTGLAASACNAPSAGYDILFTSSNGTSKLSHEIEYFDDSTGALVAWVNVPSLTNPADTTIYMYYGNSSCINQQDVANVWDTNYGAVWHLDETPSDGTVGGHEDSTASGNDGTPQNFQDSGGGSTNATGRIDGADLFGGDDDYITVPSPSNIDPANRLTASAWIRPDTSTHSGEVVTRGDSYTIRVWPEGRVLFSKYNGSGWVNLAPEGVDIIDGQLHYVVAVQRATGMFLYIDGAQVDSNTDTSSIAYTLGATAEIGRHGNGSPDYAFTGIIDEVRISRTDRTAGWIATEYRNQSSPGTFYGLGSEQALPRVEITVSVYHTDADGSSPAEIVTSATTAIGPSTSNPYALSIGNGALQTYTAGNPQRLRALITVTSVSGGGSFTLAYDSGINLSSLDTPVLTVPEWNLAFLALVPLVPMLTSFIWRRKRLAARLALVLASVLIPLGILAQQVGIAGASPDALYLHDAGTSGITPAGRTMNISQGVGASTMTFDSLDDDAYWYTDLTYPTGSDPASIAAGNYTLNMYFSQLPAYQTIAVDAVSTGTGTGTSITVSHTTGSGTNRLMLVGISASTAGPTIAVSSITYGGVALSLVGLKMSQNSPYLGVWIYKLVNPPAGTANVVVTFSAAATQGGTVGVATYTGVDQSTPLGTFVSNWAASTITPTVNASSASGELVFDTVCAPWASISSVGAGQTQRWRINPGGGSTEPGAASVTMSWTLASANEWAIGAVPIKPAAASVAITVSVYHTQAGGGNPVEIITSASTIIDANTPNPYALSIGSGALQTYTAADPQRLRVLVDVTAVNGSGSFTLAYDSATNHSSLDTPVMTVPEWNLVFLALVPLVPLLTSFIWRRKRLAARLALVLLTVVLAFASLTGLIPSADAAPDVFYLHNTATSGITPAGRYMNTTLGTGGSTLAFDTAAQNAYWYLDQTWPTGSGNGGIAAGAYTLNMYFNELPRSWWNANYLYRQRITVTAGSVAVPTAYSVSVTFDHAALVTAGKSLSSGNDIRIVYWNGSSWTELDRLREDGTTWNSTTTKVWFRTQAAISASGTDSNYYMYYGYSSAGTPPTTWSNVFLLYDDFNDASFDTARWTCLSGTCTESGGNLTLSGTTSYIQATSGYAFGTGTMWEARVQLTSDGTETYFDFWGASNTAGWSDDWIEFWTDSGASYRENANEGTVTSVAYTASTPTSFHVYGIGRIGTTSVPFYRDYTLLATSTTNIPDENLRVYCGKNTTSYTIIYDFARVRNYVSPEPTTAFGAEATSADVRIVVTVSHTASDGSGATTIISSSTTTINSSTANPYALSIGSGALQTFTSGDPRRLRVQVNVSAVNGGERFVLAYDSGTNHSSLDTPVVTVPEWNIAFLMLVPLIPLVMSTLWRRRRLAGRLISLGLACSIVLGMLAAQVSPASADPDTFYLHDLFQEVQTGGSSSSTTVATSASVTGVTNNLYLAAISIRPGSVTVSSISGLGLTWTRVLQQCSGNSTETRVDVWRALGTPTGNGVVTATLSGTATYAVIAVTRYAGVNTTNPIGATTSANVNGVSGSCTTVGTASSLPTVNLTTSYADSQVYGAFAINSTSFTAGTWFTERADFRQASTAGVAVEDRPVLTASTVAVNGILSGTTQWAVVAVEIRRTGISPSPTGRTMNTTTGSAGSAMTFDTVGQNGYWYVDQTWPTGGGNATIAAGNYTLNMYFNSLPMFARSTTTGEALAGATTMTIPHTVAGTNTALMVGVSMNNDSLETVSTITWAGGTQSLTFIGYAQNPASGADDARVEIWGLLAPTAGTYNVVVTFSAALSSSSHAYAGVVTLNGANQSTQDGADGFVGGDYSSPATVTIASTVGDLVFGAVASEYGALTVGAGQTELWNLYYSAFNGDYGAGSVQPGASSVTTSWTVGSTSSNHWAIGALSVRPSSSSVSITVYVHHTKADGTDPQLITSASTTISSSTSSTLALSLGSGALQTFTSADPRRLRVQISVTAVTGSGSFALAFDGTCGTSRCANLATPTVTVPESAVALVPIGLLIPVLVCGWWRGQRPRGGAGWDERRRSQGRRVLDAPHQWQVWLLQLLEPRFTRRHRG